MILWNKKLYWMKDTNVVSKFGKRQVYQILGPLKMYLREKTDRKWIESERRTLRMKYFEIIAPYQDYQIEIDQLYDATDNKYYIIRLIEPYSSFMIKNHLKLTCEENAEYGK